MKQKCKQCGKEFEMSQSEMDFYKNKNLDLPKRCSECREKNKEKGKLEDNNLPEKTLEDNPPKFRLKKTYDYGRAMDKSEEIVKDIVEDIPEKTPKKKKRSPKSILYLIFFFVIVGVLVYKFSSFVINYNDYIDSIYDTETTETEDIIWDHDYDTESDYTNYQGNDEATTANGSEDSNISTESTVETEDKTEVAVATEQLVTTEATTATTQAPLATGLSFRSIEFRTEHYNKHGAAMGFASPEEYERAAAAVVNGGSALFKTEAEDGDGVYYIEATNDFVVVSTDGYIRTYFHPDDGIEYFNRQ